MKKKRKIPEKVDLGAEIFEIHLIPKLLSNSRKKIDGDITHNQSRLRLDADVSEQTLAITTLHECAHYWLVTFGQIEAVNPERLEGVIESVATGIMIFIRKNPEFIKYIQELDDES